MNDYDQRGQMVGTQLIAETINQNYGVPFEQYKANLAEKEIEIRQLLVNTATSEKDKEILSIELAEVERKRGDEQESYKAHVKDLEERINRLDRLRGQLPEKLINEAKQALAVGDNSKAEQLFIQVEEQADPHISVAAEAAYQRGKLSEEAISYSEAIKHYQRATQLTPDNNEYLNAAGGMLYILGESQKAIEYFEQALASDLKTYGEGHPRVATERNNLGSAWHSLGEYQKAIGYFEQALKVFQNRLSEEHPHSKTVQSNLNAVKAKVNNLD